MMTTHVCIANGELYSDMLEDQLVERNDFISNARADFMQAVTRYFNHNHNLSEDELNERRLQVSIFFIKTFLVKIMILQYYFFSGFYNHSHHRH